MAPSSPGRAWQLDQVVLTINGRRPDLWRTVDQDGVVLAILVQSRRKKDAATPLFKHLLGTCAAEPRVVIPDTLHRYAAALATILPNVEHRQPKGLHNRAENAHQPPRQRERQMRRFKSAGQAQQVLRAFGPIRGYVCLGRHRVKAADYRTARKQRFDSWNAIMHLGAMAYDHWLGVRSRQQDGFRIRTNGPKS